MGGIGSGLSKGPILRALYGSRNWTYKATDATGTELTAETFRPPDLASAVADYRRTRAEMESLEARFRAGYETKTQGDTTCTANEDPASGI